MMQALVIDDSRAIRQLLRSFIADLGFEVTEATDGRDALGRLETLGSVDLMLVDWNMPNMTGIEFVRAVRSNRTHEGARVMMVTTEGEMDRVVEALEAGANEYIMKPFSRKALREKLRILGFAGPEEGG